MSSLLRIALSILLVGVATFANAQTSSKPKRVGILSLDVLQNELGRPGPRLVAGTVEEGLKQLGWIEGKNIEFVRKTAGDTERLPQLADELINERVDVIVALAGINTLAKKTSTIPIVMSGGFLPVRDGLAVSLSRPGKNITGTSLGSEPLIGNKAIFLLKQAAPGTSRVAIVVASKNPPPEVVWDEEEDGEDYKAHGITIFFVTFWGVAGLKGAFEEAKRQRADAMMFFISPGLTRQEMQDRISELAIRYRMPVGHDYLPPGGFGGIMAFGHDLTVGWRRLPYYVDRVLRGENPAVIPIEEPSKYELHVNLKAAKAIGVKVPESVLIQADRIIQ